MQEIGPKVSKSLSLAEGVLVIFIAILSDKISEVLNIPPSQLITLFGLLLVLLILVRLRAAGSVHLSESLTSIAATTTVPPGIVVTNASRIAEVVFPLGLLIGVVLASLATLLLRGTTPPIGVEVSMVYPYEVAAAIAGLVSITIVRFRSPAMDVRYFGIALGLGQAAAVSILASEENSLILTVIQTPLLYFAFALLLRIRSGRPRDIVTIAVVLGALIVTPFALMRLGRTLVGSSAEGQSGGLELYSLGRQKVYYEHVFEQTPFLTLRLNGMNPDSVRFRVIEQDSTSFEVEIDASPRFPVSLYFDARGHPASTSH